MDGGSWFIERACHIGLDIQCSRGPLSPSVRRTEVLPVPVCPTVLPKQKCTRCKTPSDREVGMRSLARFYAGSCTVSWSTRSCFYPWYFTREPSNAIQLSRYAKQVYHHNTYQLVRVVVERRRASRAAIFSSPASMTGAFKIGGSVSCRDIGPYMLHLSCRRDWERSFALPR